MAETKECIVISDDEDDGYRSLFDDPIQEALRACKEAKKSESAPDSNSTRKKRRFSSAAKQHSKSSNRKPTNEKIIRKPPSNETREALQAIRSCSRDKLIALLNQASPKLDVNEKFCLDHPQHTTLLHQCAKLGRYGSATLLLNHKGKARANILDGSEASPLDEAVFNGNLKMAQLLVEHKCDPRIHNDRKGTVLHTACSEGHVQVVQWLVELGLDIEQQDADGFTPLMWCTNASAYTDAEGKGFSKARKRPANLLPQDPNFLEFSPDDGRATMAYLLSKKANVNAQDMDQNTTLMWACSYNSEAMVALLLRHNCDMSKHNSNGDTALTADKTGLVIREQLWRAVEDVKLADVQKALESSLKQTDLPLTGIPLFNSTLTQHDTFYASRLGVSSYPYPSAFVAIHSNDFYFMDQADASSDADEVGVTSFTFRRPTPFHLAVGHKTTDILCSLLKAIDKHGLKLGLKLNVYDYEGLLPIHRAVRLVRHDSVSMLLTGANAPSSSQVAWTIQANFPDAKRKFTPLMHACYIEQQEERSAIFNLLLSYCSRIDQRDSWGNTVITHAAARGQLDLLEALFKHSGLQPEFQAALNASNQWANTALHYTGFNDSNHKGCASFLIQCGLQLSNNLHGLSPGNKCVEELPTPTLVIQPVLTPSQNGILNVDISCGKSIPISLINTIDQLSPKFEYRVTMAHAAFDIPSMQTSFRRCETCKECSETCECALTNGQCNVLCNCGLSCPFKYADVGAVPLQVFRKPDGWGVRPLAVVSPGSFVARITGELIEWREAMKRLRKRAVTAPMFSFGGNSKPVLDLSRFSNVSRFLSTSCQPNLYVKKTFAHAGTNPEFPEFLLFAARPIMAQEELTFGHDPAQCLLHTMQPLAEWRHFVNVCS